MKQRMSAICVLAVTLLAGQSAALALGPVGTEFTYQGLLKDGGSPADGDYDFQFTLWDANSGGSQVGGMIPIADKAVAEGLFTVVLDFGSGVFNGTALWLQVAVRPGSSGGSHTPLTPLQPLTAAPYALYALDGPGGGYWSLTGNVGTGAANFLGTTDDKTLELKVNNKRVLRLEPSPQNTGLYEAPNLIAGHDLNYAGVGVFGAIIAGGGGEDDEDHWPNKVLDSWGTVGGGRDNWTGDGVGHVRDRLFATVGGGNSNRAVGRAATIAGGNGNIAMGNEATVPGGWGNRAGGDYSFAAGAQARVRDAAASGDPDGDEGTFVWADFNPAPFTSTGPNQFLIRAAGGVGINTNAPQAALHIGGTPGVDGVMFPDGSLQTTAGAGGGFWSANGNSISNTNSGYVGIGTSNPQYTLHVYKQGSGGSYPPARLGCQWRRSTDNDWFSVEVGGDGVGWGSGTRLIREAGTNLSFQTEVTMLAAMRSTQMTLDANGRLGIGITNPSAMLDAHNDSTAANTTAVRGVITTTVSGSGSAGVWGHNNSVSGYGGYGVKGSHDGLGAGVYGVAQGTGVYGDSTGGATGVYGTSVGGKGVWGSSTNGVGVYGSSQNGYAGFFNGTVSVDVLEIAGADLAEKFPVSEEVKPGMVVAIDPKHPGKLCLARGTYNRCVAGVVSGANGLAAGAILGHLPGHDDAPAIALTGRVWVHCDASSQAIKPGDLLTTAQTPGHAMKVIDYTRGQGAIIGKAMTILDQGETGMVLVLVNLQ